VLAALEIDHGGAKILQPGIDPVHGEQQIMFLLLGENDGVAVVRAVNVDHVGSVKSIPFRRTGLESFVSSASG
jgi:hypothetical protein